MDDSETSEDGGGTTGERFTSFTKRNFVLVAVFFLSNLLTAVSTLVTAVTVLRETQTDWHAAEYRKLRELRAGYTLEKFQKELGPPVFRTSLDEGSGLTRNIYRPREEYWVDAISNKYNATVTYAVTTCDPTFRPEFFFEGNERHRVVLSETTLSEVLPPAQEQFDGSLKIYFGGTGSSANLVFRVYGSGGGTNYRQFAWGLNDVCPTWHAKTPGYDLMSSWAKWYQEHRPGPTEDLPGYSFLADQRARDIMAESVVNTYAETALGGDMLTYYPDQIGVSRLIVAG
jgi:hypothetical protein